MTRLFEGLTRDEAKKIASLFNDHGYAVAIGKVTHGDYYVEAPEHTGLNYKALAEVVEIEFYTQA